MWGLGSAVSGGAGVSLEGRSGRMNVAGVARRKGNRRDPKYEVWM